MRNSLIVTLAAALLLQAAPLVAQDAGDAYLDAAARELVERARSRRVTTDRRIEAYQTTAVERISVGLRVGIAEKLLYRRETASRIDWKRDTVRIEVVGAREVMPPVSDRPQVPLDLARYVPHLAFDPVDSEMLLRFDTTVIRHPLAAGSEAHYRFASGDSTVIRLQDGRTVRLRELRILPRRRDPHLINGSFWLDAESHAVVQAYFRLARAIESDADDDDGPPFLRPVGAELDYIAIDYGLWDLRWWLPRSVAARGVFQAGAIRMPMSYERRYQQYTVTGDTLAAPPVPGEAPVMETRPCRSPMGVTIAISPGDEPTDTTTARYRRMRARQAARDSARAARRAAQSDSTRVCDRAFTVTMAPSAELLAAELLPASIYDRDAEILSAEELRGIAERIRAIPEAPWEWRPPVLQYGLGTPGLIRYNRVEGLSVGVRARLDFGRLQSDAELRFGTADRELSGELGVTRAGDRLHLRAAAYHRLDIVDITRRPFGPVGALGALLLGRDDADYFRTTGAELRIAPPVVHSQWYDLRLFAERQRTVEKHTDFSLAHMLDDERVFPENRPADAADQLGAVLRLRAAVGVDPGAPRVAGQLELHGELGDYELLRPRLLLRTSTPLFRPLSLGSELEGGINFGEPPAQRRWQLGGAPTVRGYSSAANIGETFWRARIELGLGLPLARLALFGDAGWAGARDDWARGRPIRAVGIGASVLDGLFRIDVARALDLQRGWKVHLQTNGIL